ncbi:MAG: glycolate oxidase subunit GlcE [Gammaproteobacteria bacterium]|nr:MAG: glycolate oxidase subunit GlcE [Gammaproteobacteria bacterium]
MQARELVEHVRAARENGQALWIAGNGSRLAPPEEMQTLPLSGFSGIVEYDPGELAITVRCGTPLAELEATVAEAGQTLGFEAPGRDTGTVGGMLACGRSGPARPWLGDVRGAVLGVAMINGAGELLRFGGRVMKNVAGYDLSRLQCGAYGIFGPVLEVSLRTRPAPPVQRCLVRPCPLEKAVKEMADLQHRPWPIAGLAWWEGMLHLRLWGMASGVAEAAAAFGGEEEGEEFWQVLREERHPGQRDWRLLVPPAAELAELQGTWLIDWGGGRRWYQGDAPAEAVQAAARAVGGLAEPWPFTPFAGLSEDALALHHRLKAAFDPAGLFNPGLLPGEAR